MVLDHIITHGLIYAAVVNLYLFLNMITLSPRIWGFQDYPETVKRKVPPQTKRERTIAALVSLPWLVFSLGFPIYSTLLLKSKLGGDIHPALAFINILAQLVLAWAVDMVVLDWLIIAKITPRFVIIDGSEAADYKDFSHHFRGHYRALLVIVPLSMLIAGALAFL